MLQLNGKVEGKAFIEAATASNRRIKSEKIRNNIFNFIISFEEEIGIVSISAYLAILMGFFFGLSLGEDCTTLNMLLHRTVGRKGHGVGAALRKFV